jgi:4'-phosphopantetheinyl transferase
LNFNLSHSAGLALYAFARDQEVGVDVERVRFDIEHEQIAERFFSPYERSVLRSLPAEEKAETFFACWTRKEAFIKAHGEGLSLPLDQFDVSLASGEPARLLAGRGGN